MVQKQRVDAVELGLPCRNMVGLDVSGMLERYGLEIVSREGLNALTVKVDPEEFQIEKNDTLITSARRGVIIRVIQCEFGGKRLHIQCVPQTRAQDLGLGGTTDATYA